MDDFDWNLVKSFLAVAETGSLSAAARRLKASQPTLGRHMAELEGRLGVTLVEVVTHRGMENLKFLRSLFGKVRNREARYFLGGHRRELPPVPKKFKP